MNLTTIKPEIKVIKIGKEIYPLKYDLNAFAFIEENLNSVNEAIKLFNEKDFEAIAIIFQAGLIHTERNYNILKILKKTDPKKLIAAIAEAINGVICSDYGFDKEFDWALLYFIAKPVLNFSEEEFWSSTPKKILTMMKMIEEMKNGKQEEILEENQAVQAFMAW